MEVENLVKGVLVGGVTLLGGFVLRKLSDWQTQEVSYLHQVPQFTDFLSLRNHLKNSPDQKADVLVEGRVGKLGDAALVSDKAGMEGAARLITTTTYTKVYNEETGKWREISNTHTNMKASLPFKLEDPRGSTVRVESVHTAGGFSNLLQRVFQDKRVPEQRSIGDFATNVVTLQEIPNGTLTRDYLLLFNTTLAGFGSAVLQKQSLFSSGEVVFTPTEVNSSIRGLITRNEMMADAMKIVSVILLVAGGGILVFSLTPILVALFRRTQQEGRPLSNNEES